jgi:hypothetical protein
MCSIGNVYYVQLRVAQGTYDDLERLMSQVNRLEEQIESESNSTRELLRIQKNQSQ